MKTAIAGLVSFFFGLTLIQAQSTPDADSARTAMLKAADFMTENVSESGGYLWKYNEDLSLQEGEVVVSASTVWVQPPGTPTVGEAFLYAYQLTNEERMLDAARAAAHCLVAGQLNSGGWDYRIEFTDTDRMGYAYRMPPSDDKARNTTTLDDNVTQSALRFLMHMDRELEMTDRVIHDAVQYALNQLLKAQYPNGAWPQRFSEIPDAEDFPILKASFPEDWPRSYPRVDYRSFYTFNDNTIADMVETMFEAYEIYGDERCRNASLKAGDFMLLAQLPEPQPGWAQQYNASMHPAWARKFEPAAVTGGESQGVMSTLLRLYELSGERRFLEPIPRALSYYKRSVRPDGRLARFYEIGTNKPLYFTRDYKVTYSDADMPTHYGFIVGNKLDRIEQRYRQLADSEHRPAHIFRRPTAPRASRSLSKRAAETIKQMDRRGAWVESGSMKSSEAVRRIIDCGTFARNLRTLADCASAHSN